ncbi:MAG: tRNA pseudouridine(55) synthase TruB [Dehalococcoidia bacterium]
MSSQRTPHHGVLLVDKEPGWTSHDVVAKVRGLFGQKKVGHTGTLDPMATGLLVVCLGRATRLAEYMVGHDKTYEGTVALGATTDTDDAEGNVLSRREVPPISEADVRRLTARFTGRICQVPPQYSAIKKQGERAYAVARRGGSAELEARPIVIHDLTVAVSHAGQCLDIGVHCGPGTYIRSLSRDIGEALGCGGHLASLRRTSAGPFNVAEAQTLASIEAVSAAERGALLKKPGTGLESLPRVHVNKENAVRLAGGLSVEVADLPEAAGPILVYCGSDLLVGVAGRIEGDGLKCRKVLATREELDLC